MFTRTDSYQEAHAHISSANSERSMFKAGVATSLLASYQQHWTGCLRYRRPHQVKSPLSKMLQKSKFAPLSSVTLQPDVGTHTVCARTRRRMRNHQSTRSIPNQIIDHVTFIGFLYLHCTHTRYIFNCFPLFTCSLRST